MKPPPRAHILAIGDELVRGASLDTNSQRIAAWLEGAGVEVVAHSLVSDDPDALLALVERASRDAAVLVSTGGLGPTEDDRTRDVAARWAGVELVRHDPSLRRLERWAEARGRTLSPSNLRQVLLPAGAQVLGNPVGTAPGFRVTRGDCQWFAMPGVPYEMERMMRGKVLPGLRQGFSDLGTVCSTNLILVGLPESVVGERIAPWMAHDREPKVGITAGGGLLKVRIVARGATQEAARASCAATTVEVRPLVAEVLVAEVDGAEDPDLAALVLDRLKASGRSMTTAESCTGGLVGQQLTEHAGASAVYPGGYIVYSNAAKTRDLGVPPALIEAHGAVSREVAQAMALGALERTGADVALAITGVAGPDGGTTDKPVGTVCFGLALRAAATAGPPNCETWRRDFGAMPRGWLRRRSAADGLAAVLKALGD